MVSWFTRKRKLNIIILVVFIVFLIVVVSIPDQTYGQHFIGENGAGTGFLKYSLKIGSEPRLNYTMSVAVHTVGGLSAGEDLYVQVWVRDISPSNWNDTYCCLTFVTSGALGLPPVIYLSSKSPKFMPSSPPFTLHYFPNGTYYTDGHLYVSQPVVLWVAFGNPSWNGTQAVLETRAQVAPIVNITGTISDSQSVKLTEVAIKIGFIFGSFSVLFVQPILESIILNEDKQNKTTYRK